MSHGTLSPPHRIALTGASGVLGRHILALLARDRVEVLAASRKVPADQGEASSWEIWDLQEWREPDALDELFPAATAVVHAGALVRAPGVTMDCRTLFDANIRATWALGGWALARGIPMIFISGATVYAAAEGGRPAENDELAWQGATGGAYGHSKLLAEAALWPLRQEGLNLAVLRPSSIYGTGMASGKLIPTWLEIAAKDETIFIDPPAKDCIDLVHAADVARAVKLTLDRRAWATFNVASGAPQTLMEIAQACVCVAGRGRVIVRETTTDRPPQLRFALNTEYARRALDFQASIEIEQGLKLMLRRRHTPD